MMRLPGWQQRALDRIEQALVAEDPGFGLRFAFFARLTRYEAIPLTEQVPGRLQRVLRRVIVFPLLGISLAAVLAASWLIASRQACSAGPNAAATTVPSLSHAAHCRPGPAIMANPMPAHGPASRTAPGRT
ncbi:MAG TPA: hypothetical protein VGH53_15995 [Streptosporangiaceae bacterium]|jgi:hypothetical protein